MNIILQRYFFENKTNNDWSESEKRLKGLFHYWIKEFPLIVLQKSMDLEKKMQILH